MEKNKKRISNEPVIFKFKISNTLTLSENIEKLLIELRLNNALFLTQSLLNPRKKNLVDQKFNIYSISIKGAPSYINAALDEIYPLLNKSFENYFNSDENVINKEYEIANMQYQIKVFFQQIEIYAPYRENYKLVLKNNDMVSSIPFDNFRLLNSAKKELEDHYTIRKTFLLKLMGVLELQHDKLLLNEKWAKLQSPKIDRKKKYDVLEFWQGLLGSEYLKYLNDDKRLLLEKRKMFFNFFGLSDSNYNDLHGNYKNSGRCGFFLKRLVRAIEREYPNKSSKK